MWIKIGDTVAVEEDLKGTDETVEDVVPVAPGVAAGLTDVGHVAGKSSIEKV
jgi:hypothetical protein